MAVLVGDRLGAQLAALARAAAAAGASRAEPLQHGERIGQLMPATSDGHAS